MTSKKYHTLLNKTENKQTHRYRKEISDLPEVRGEEHVGKKEKDLSNGILKVIQLYAIFKRYPLDSDITGWR